MTRFAKFVGLLLMVSLASLGAPAPAAGQTSGDTTGKIISGSIPSDGGFGLVVYGGGTFDQLVTASGCPVTRVVFWFTINGGFVVLVPGTSVGAVNAGAQAAFPSSTVPANTPLIGRCIPGPSTQLQVTLADDDGTLTLHVGDTFLLNLGETYNWTAQAVDTSVVSRILNVAVIRGAQGLYRANGSGTTTLAATGSLNCPAGTPCPALARLFRIVVVVQ